jgi:hypothetical protein
VTGSDGFDADKTAAAKAIIEDKGTYGSKTATVATLTATCYFVSMSDFTAVNLGKVKDGAKSTVKTTADYANKFSAGCYLAGNA